MIFNKLPQLEMLKLRYVCQDWRCEVDEFGEFSVNLDDRQPHLERISQLRIKSCKVIHFKDINSVFSFKYPGLLKRLKIITEKISPENFSLLMKDTCPHLKQFCAILPLNILSSDSYSPNLSFKFDNLVKLRLSISTMPEGPIMGPPKFQDRLFHKIIQIGSSTPTMKKLKMLAIEIRCLGFQQVSRFSSAILTFIAQHHQALQHVDFDMIQGHGMPLTELRPLSESDLEQIDFKALKNVKNLQSIRVVNSTAIGVDIWSQVLANQRSLHFLETDILPAPNQLYRQIILNNETTLVHIDIGDLTIDPDSEDEDMRRFDAAVFQNCCHLRKLTLDRNCLVRRPSPDNLVSAELINLHCLPAYLKELAINYFFLLSDELLILFSGDLGKSLQSLALTQCGDSEGFGVDGTVLEKIISMANIGFIEISPLNFSDPEERLKLNVILTTYGYNEGHSYFSLSKVSHNFQVSFDDFMP